MTPEYDFKTVAANCIPSLDEDVKKLINSRSKDGWRVYSQSLAIGEGTYVVSLIFIKE